MTVRIGVVVSTEYDGGGEQYLRRLYRGLVDEFRVEPTLLGRLDGWEDDGLPAIDVGLGPKWSFSELGRLVRSAPTERRAALEAIRREHARQPFDLFHLQYKREQLLLTRGLAELAPVVWTEHGRLPTGAKGQAVTRAYRRAARDVAHVICVSDDVAQDVAQACGSSVPIDVIETAVDDARFRPADAARRRVLRHSLDIDDDRVLLATVTRLHPHKRVERAIEAVRGRDDCTLIVVGDGEERTRLESLARGEPVRFTGWIDDPESVLRAAEASILCHSSRGEGFPTTMVEAAASGCALIGFAGDAMNAEVRHSGGLVIDAGRPLDDADIASLPPRRQAAIEWAGGYRAAPWRRRHHDVLMAASSGRAESG